MAKKTVNTDQRTLDLIQKVKTQKAEIGRAEKPSWKTSCTFTYVEGKLNDAINLHVESKVHVLIGIAEFIRRREAGYAAAAEELGVVNPPQFTWQGFTATDWISDLKARVTKIQIEVKKQNLNDLENRLDKIISPELKAQMELEAIEASLK